MKSLIFVTLFAFSNLALAGPVEFVKTAFTRVSHGGTSTMCSLAKNNVAIDYVARAVIGKKASSDPKSFADFKLLVPSIIVTDLQKIKKYLKMPMTFSEALVSRGGGSKGVQLSIEVSKDSTLKMVIVTTSVGGQLKITDFEVTSYNTRMTASKRVAYAKIMNEDPSHALGHLVDTLRKDRDLIDCR